MMRYIIFIIVEVIVVLCSLYTSADLENITGWLMGVNFTLAIFAINFTFFGYQLSKYKPIYGELTKRQWFNIMTLIVLPIVPLLSYLALPEYFSKVALWVLPVIFVSAFDNARLTTEQLNVNKFIDGVVTKKRFEKYLERLSTIIEGEVQEHDAYLKNSKHFQIPMHARKFEPSTLGLQPNDLWDSITLATNLAMDNNDYPVFRRAINAALQLVVEFYSFKPDGENYKLESGMRAIAQYRFRSIITSIAERDRNGIFLQSLSKELCQFLQEDEVKNFPCSDLARSVVSDAIWVGTEMLESNSVVEPINILNTVHQIIELGIHRLETQDNPSDDDYLEKHSIAVYAFDIKELGVSALNSGNSHFAYRCMETLSYLGCNAAKSKSRAIIINVLESIVQLGRVARSLQSGCFDKRCLIRFDSHAEEFMGHILNWLVHDLDSNGNFFMKASAEQAYSRLRGVQCVIKPKGGLNPAFWIDELKIVKDSIHHVEHQSGMYGYDGHMDYSDFSNLKEFALHGISSLSGSEIFQTPLIDAEIET